MVHSDIQSIGMGCICGMTLLTIADGTALCHGDAYTWLSQSYEDLPSNHLSN